MASKFSSSSAALTAGAFLLLISVAGCSQPDYDGAGLQFEKENPECVALSAAPGEGDSDDVYVIIKYKCGEKLTGEAEWLYQRKDGQWKRTNIVLGPASPPEPMKPGPGVTPPVLIDRVEPKWPEGPTDAKTFIFEATITKTGGVEDVRLVKGPDDLFAKAAADAMRQSRFKPGLYRGQPVAVRFPFSVTVDVR